MRAMILAAGRGTRMGVLTESIPKPLLRVGNFRLIEYALFALKKAHVEDIIINISYKAQMIQDALGDGQRYGVNLNYSYEEEALETGGGIIKALPFFKDEPFLVMSCDIISNFPLSQLVMHHLNSKAHLIFVNNPIYHPRGDYGLENNIVTSQEPRFTFASIGVYHPQLFSNFDISFLPLNKILQKYIALKEITGDHYSGQWFNIGSPQDISEFETKAAHRFLL